MNHVPLVVSLICCLAIGAAALILADQSNGTSTSVPHSVSAPQLTSDDAWSLEVAQLATTAAHQSAMMTSITSDAAWELEQNLLLEQNSWGEDFGQVPASAPYLPSPDDAQFVTNRTISY
jgi:hypothetical protein